MSDGGLPPDELGLVLLAAGILAGSGVACLAAPRAVRDRAFAVLCGLGGVLGAIAALAVLLRGDSVTWSREWLLPIGRLGFRLDPLAAIFLLPVFFVPPLAAVYATAYWPERERGPSAAVLRFFFGLLAAAMALVLVAENGVALLVAWEIMAAAAFFAVLANGAEPGVRAASWVYLAATHLGTLCLLGFFTLLTAVAGSADLVPLAAGNATPGELRALFLLGLVGFGLKAGIFPLHVWLPGAHASAPSHVSAVLSGVMLKIGVYGLVRITGILPLDSGAGWILIGLGAASAILGVLFALGQGDAKRLLAYSSVENVGLVVMGLGLALLGRSEGRPALAVLGLTGALLHVWNHAVFKSLLFLVAGSLLHATGTRRLSELGGMAARMPRTTRAAAAACLSATALPPWSGFASEWLLFLAVATDLLGRTLGVAGGRDAVGGGGVGAAAPGVPGAVALAAVALAFTAGLALLVFARLFGVGFLGAARSDRVRQAHDPGPAMGLPLALLALVSLALGLGASWAVLPIERVVAAWVGPAVHDGDLLLAAAAGLRQAAFLGFGILLGAVALFALVRRSPIAASRPGTWDCGYLRPSARMQYGESSLAETIVGLFRGVLRPRGAGPAVQGLFPARTRFDLEVPDTVLERALLPALILSARGAARFRQLQPARVQMHLLYILVGLLLLLIFV